MRPLVVASSIDQGQIAAEALGQRNPLIITTNGRRGLAAGLYPLPDDVHYAAGWELGRNAGRLLAQLQRAYAKRLPSGAAA